MHTHTHTCTHNILEVLEFLSSSLSLYRCLCFCLCLFLFLNTCGFEWWVLIELFGVKTLGPDETCGSSPKPWRCPPFAPHPRAQEDISHVLAVFLRPQVSCGRSRTWFSSPGWTSQKPCQSPTWPIELTTSIYIIVFWFWWDLRSTLVGQLHNPRMLLGQGFLHLLAMEGLVR